MHSQGIQELADQLIVMEPSQFEVLIASVIKRMGYPRVRVTGGAGDKGIDIIAEGERNGKPFRAAAQCKRYREPITPRQVREFHGAVANKFDAAYFFTTSSFTRQALQDCELYRIKAVNGLQIAMELRKFGLA